MAASTRDRSRWIKGLFYTTLISSLFWGGIAQFDPFGVKTAASIQSESFFMRIIGGPWYQSVAQDKINVVLAKTPKSMLQVNFRDKKIGWEPLK